MRRLNKQLYVMQQGKPVLTTIRTYTEGDIEALIDVQRECFPPPFPEELWWNQDQLRSHINLFPEGALCAEVDGIIVGSMTGLIVAMEQYRDTHQWATVTDNGYIRNHNPNGDTLYVVDIAVKPAFRKSGIGKWLMQSMYETVVHLSLTSLVGGGRMPNYVLYQHELTAEQYVEKVIAVEISDPVLSFLLRCGRVPIGVAEQYLEDEQSCNYAAIMEWKNPFKAAR